MSKEALAKVVQRAISDAAFRRQLNSDPAGALRGFDLSSDEMSAIRTGDAGRLTTLGVDQRMSKAYGLGGGLASTKMSASDLTPGGGPSMVDDLSGAGGKTVIPSDPTRPGGSADIDAGTGSMSNTVRVGDDYKFAGRQAPDAGGSTNVRAGDDYKFAGRQAPDSATSQARVGDDWKYTSSNSQANAAPVEGSPEADAAAQAAGRAADSGRIGTARLDDASGGASGSANVIHDDPNGFLAANADAGGSVTRANVIHDDPNGFLAANADATDAAARANVIHDDPNGFLAANANAPTGGSTGDGTAFLDESESYLTKVGYDASAAAGTDATVIHDDPDGFLAANADDVDGGSSSSSDGPNVQP